MPAVVATDVLMEELVAFAEAWPLVTLDLCGSYELSDLRRREADVAIRFMPIGHAPQGDLVGRHVATAWTAIYGDADRWIGYGADPAEQDWVRRTPFPDLPIRSSIVDGGIMRSACAAGLGKARPPCFLAEPDLTRRSEPEPGLDVWVLVHSDLRQNPRLRAYRDAIVDALRRLRPRLPACGPIATPSSMRSGAFGRAWRGGPPEGKPASR